MVSGRRDRHGRGRSGPLAAPNPYTGRPVTVPGQRSRADFFAECVSDSLDRIGETCPQALNGVIIGVEDVPDVLPMSGDDVPLAAAVGTIGDDGDRLPARVVIYRRPLEHRADSRVALRLLVHRTIVAQLAVVTGLERDTIDPDVEPYD